MSDVSLCAPLRLVPYPLSHRVVMAPVTRMRAQQPGYVLGEFTALYYTQRASAGGLLMSEGSPVSPRGRRYPATPGIHSPEQVAGWRLVTESFHRRGDLIFVQLWHVGRMSHSSYQPDDLPLAPSQGSAPTAAMFRPFFSGILISAVVFTHKSANKDKDNDDKVIIRCVRSGQAGQ